MIYQAHKGYALLIGTLLSFSVSTLTVDWISRYYPHISPYESLLWGWMGAILLASPFYLFSGKARKAIPVEIQRHWKLLLITCTLTSAGALMWFWAIFQTSSGLVGLLGQVELAFAFLLGVFFLKEKVTTKELAGLTVAVVGFGVISQIKGEINTTTVIVILISNFLYATQSLLVKRYGQKMNTVVYTYIRTIIMTALMSTILFSIMEIKTVSFLPWLILAGGQFFGFIVGRYCYFEAHKYLPISTLNVLLLFDPVVVLFATYWIFGDDLSLQKLAGAALIVGGLLFFVREKVRVSRNKSIRQPDITH